MDLSRHPGDRLTIRYGKSVNSPVTIEILGMDGRIIGHQTLQIYGNEGTFVLPSGRFNGGTLILRISDGKTIISRLLFSASGEY